VGRLWRHEARGHLLPIAGLSLVSGLATLAAPALRDVPLVLVLLSPRLPFLVLASTGSPFPLLFVLATARLCVTDIHYFTLGRRFGSSALAWLPGGAAIGRRWERLPALAPVLLVLIRPIGRHLALAGTTPVSAAAVGVADVAGTAAYVTAVCGIGAACFGA
jgi:hypothetical protein